MFFSNINFRPLGPLKLICSVPQTGAMYYYMDEEQYQNAYEIACIGVTSSDWNYLGNKTLKKLQLQLSAKAFSHTRNYRMLVLINDLIKMKNSGAR